MHIDRAFADVDVARPDEVEQAESAFDVAALVEAAVASRTRERVDPIWDEDAAALAAEL